MNIFGSFEKDLVDQEERLIANKVKAKSKEKLFSLYLACLTGRHANMVENQKEAADIAKTAFLDAKSALEVWNEWN